MVALLEGRQILFLGFVIHLIYLSSVFHIYFKSPIIKNVKNINRSSTGPAKRVVLFVADGLQAEKTFHRKFVQYTPFLRSIITRHGSWGVSHTRVPTESRVGHVSLIAGTYEDVSAITNGWQLNPVMFDSVFNQSHETWSWGSHDIVGLFDRGINQVHTYFYSHDQIDFGDSTAFKLDEWVFERVTKFFENPTEELQKRLRHDKIVFFLHLLGIDTNGHAKKPDSKEYLQNIAFVDEGIKNVTRVFDKFYNDTSTTYIVTSDHGMTPWGAHGTGLQSETETPFVAWGAGINTNTKQANVNKDLQSMRWQLEDYERNDLKQVDVAALMAYLIGVNFPVNSVGVLPQKILNMPIQKKSLALLDNARQICEQYYAHETRVKESAFIFKPFSENLTVHIEEIVQHIEKEKHLSAISKTEHLITIAVEGIAYYHQYNRLLLSVLINAGFFLWISYVVATILRDYTNILPHSHKIPAFISISRSRLFTVIYTLTSACIGLLFVKKSAEFFYVIMPLTMVKICLNEGMVFYRILLLISNSFQNSCYSLLTFSVYVGFTIAGIEIIVAGFFNRAMLSYISISMALLPWFTLLRSDKKNIIDYGIAILWTVTSVIMAIFPTLPVITRDENYMLVVIAALIVATLGFTLSFFVKGKNGNVITILSLCVVVCVINKMYSVLSVKQGTGLPIFNQLLSWSTIPVLPIIAMATENQSPTRLASFSLSLFSVYTLTAISYDALFLLVLTTQLVLWLALETRSHKRTTYMTLEHLRIAFMFTYFIFMSFFGTGNIASINSFDIATSYCFKTVFNPWVQGLVVVVKLIIPFITVVVYFRSLQSLTSLNMTALFHCILVLTDIMAVNFFFLVRDEGSWLDIGQSLSHFVITLVFIVVLLPVYELSRFISGEVQIPKEHTL